MSKLKQAKQIFIAYAKGGDVDEKLFTERYLICKECPLNSTNKFEELSVINKIRHQATEIGYCTACGCPLAKKLSVRDTVCGDIENPLW